MLQHTTQQLQVCYSMLKRAPLAARASQDMNDRCVADGCHLAAEDSLAILHSIHARRMLDAKAAEAQVKEVAKKRYVLLLGITGYVICVCIHRRAREDEPGFHTSIADTSALGRMQEKLQGSQFGKSSLREEGSFKYPFWAHQRATSRGHYCTAWHRCKWRGACFVWSGCAH